MTGATAPMSADASGMANDASTSSTAGRLAAVTAGSLGSGGSCASVGSFAGRWHRKQTPGRHAVVCVIGLVLASHVQMWTV